MYNSTTMNTLLGVYGYQDWSEHTNTLEYHAREFIKRLQGRTNDTVTLGMSYKFGKLKPGKCSEKRLIKAFEELRNGICNKISIYCFPNNSDIRRPLGILSLSFGYDIIIEQKDASYPNMLDLAFCHELIPGLYTQQELTDMLIDLSTTLKATTGFIDQAKFLLYGFESPMEEHVCFTTGIAPEKHFDSKLRGYMWGNILTKGHIAALGGKEQALQRIPHEYCQSFVVDGEEALYIQTTKKLEDFQPNQRLALKKSLDPVLYREDLFLLSAQYWTDRGEYWENLTALDEEEMKQWYSFIELYKQGCDSLETRNEMSERRRFYGTNERGVSVERKK